MIDLRGDSVNNEWDIKPPVNPPPGTSTSLIVDPEQESPPLDTISQVQPQENDVAPPKYTPTIRETIDSFERDFARPWTKEILHATCLPAPVANYVETSVTVSLLISGAFLVIVGSISLLKRSTSLMIYLAWHTTFHIMGLSLKFLGLSIQAFLIFVGVAFFLLTCKTFFVLPLQVTWWLYKQPGWREGDWSVFGTEVKRGVEELGVASLDIAELRRQSIEQFNRVASTLNVSDRLFDSDFDGVQAQLKGMQWKPLILKSTYWTLKASVEALKVMLKYTTRGADVFGSLVMREVNARRAAREPRLD
ncbi:hypothetical protein FA15DRAFT_668516 [Coprinopsis marcescibilis]|uniref:Uncharacterized protein n=1 Tax=Coprinopsis marcescibilis TaxID=230819 RepID=A0A5C3KZ13_COPMA|nr:hypothetical protein FA15DRAFT_668516 [Coprinopsis marcescibilis]